MAAMRQRHGRSDPRRRSPGAGCPRRRSIRVLLLAAGLAALVPCRALAAPLLFVSNAADDTVSVIDTALEREVQTIPAGEFPQGLALRAGEPLLAVANARARYATLIDPVRLVQLDNPVPTGMGPEDVVFSADGAVLFATSYYDRTVTASDVAARALRETIAFDATPRRLRLGPDGRELFVLLHDRAGAVAVVDVATHAVVATVPVGPFPTDMALTPDGTRLLAASFDADTVTIVDVPNRRVLETLTLDTGHGLAVHPTRPILYSMLSFDGAVLAFDYAERRSLATIEIGGGPVAGVVTPDGRFLYTVNSDGNNVTKIDTTTNQPLLRIAVGVEPTAAVLFVPPGAAGPRWGALAALGAIAALGVAFWARRRSAPRLPR